MTNPIRRGIRRDYDLAAGTAGPVTDLLTPKDATYTLYIQRITVAPTTYSAKTLTFQDDATSPVPIGFISIPASAPTAGGRQDYTIDFGEEGTPLTEGKNLDLSLSGAGVAGRIHIVGYQDIIG